MLKSFAYSRGVPKDATIVFDLRSYPSPSASMCAKYDGTHAPLRNELFHHAAYQELMDRIVSQLHAAFSGENKCDDTFVVAIGCEEGRHRSVAVVEHLSRQLRGYNVVHRDLHRRRTQITEQKQRSEQRRNKSGLANNMELYED